MEQYLTHACGGCKPKKPKGKKAFTLIELLIVITIIGILAVALLPRVLGAPARARDTVRKADLQKISTALEAYMSDNGGYPAVSAGQCLVSSDANLKTYFTDGAVPTDPLTTSTYSYGTSGSCTGTYFYQSLSRNGAEGSAYLLMAKLEMPCVAGSNFCADATKVNDSASTDGDVATVSSAIYAFSGTPEIVYGITY